MIINRISEMPGEKILMVSVKIQCMFVYMFSNYWDILEKWIYPQCDAKAGECLHDTNYCGGVYHSGLCGGGSHRKCCVIQNFKKGDHYWNHYS